ncbi:MAG: carboxymuconolactone decarboxylase family protein [Solirubrobacteraceae bacterium]
MEKARQLGAREADLARGRAVQARVAGDRAAIGAVRHGSDEVVPELGPLSDEANWGRIWAREGLDLRTRSLCVVACLLSVGRAEHALAHMQGARRLGVTRDELAEVVVQLTFYVGLPVVHEGLALVRRAFEEPPVA